VVTIYPPSSGVTTGVVVSMATVPPSMAYSMSSMAYSNAPTTTTTITHTHTLSLPHPDRQTELLGHQDRAMERQAAMKTAACSPAVSASGPAVTMRACSPPLSIYTPSKSLQLHSTLCLFRGSVYSLTYCSILVHLFLVHTEQNIANAIRKKVNRSV